MTERQDRAPQQSDEESGPREAQPSEELNDPAPEGPAPADQVEEADQESFPASDAPGWVPLHPGPPRQ